MKNARSPVSCNLRVWTEKGQEATVRITITTGGSRGDVQPYVALGLGLKAAGHEVLLAAPAAFQDLVLGRGLRFYPIALDPLESVRRQLEDGSANLLRFAKRSRDIFQQFIEGDLRACLEACRGADAVVYSSVGFLGHKIAQELELPRVGAMYGPLLSSTHCFPSSWVPVLSGELALCCEDRRSLKSPRRLYNRLSYVLSQQALWQFMRAPVNQALRAEPRLLPYPFRGPFGELWRSREPILHGWSRHVLPHPLDWGEHLPVTGYWFLDRPRDWRPPAELNDFLGSGPAPVSVGFGSMSGGDPEQLTYTVLDALKSAGQRGVLLTGWGGVSNADLPDEVFKVEEVPHDWLFPRVVAAVHHGGAGTTAASLRARVPTIVVPFFADQSFWGARVAGLGVGPSPIPRKKLSAELLAGAIRQATTDVGMRKRARLLGEKIRTEDGVGRAVEAFHLHVGRV